MACRLPGADDPRAFWHLLEQGHAALSDVPADRWNAARVPEKRGGRAGYLKNVRGFDPKPF
jgi:acyl transferase domain-containing protein